MRLFDNSKSSYEEILDIVPIWHRDILEYDMIYRAYGLILDRIREAIDAVLSNSNVLGMNAETLTLMEQFLHIPYDPKKTLAERRALVGAYYLGTSKMGAPDIIAFMSRFTAGEVTVRLVGGTVIVAAERPVEELTKLSAARELLEKRLPAHLDLMFEDITTPIELLELKKADLLFRYFLAIIPVAQFAGDMTFETIDISVFPFDNPNEMGEATLTYITPENLLDGAYALDGSMRLRSGTIIEEV